MTCIILFATNLAQIYTVLHPNWPISKPLPSNADLPIAVEYQLHGERNSDIFRFQHHRETLEDPKLASVLWGLSFKNGKIICLRYL